MVAQDFHAVRGISLLLEKQKLFCLLGHNGAVSLALPMLSLRC